MHRLAAVLVILSLGLVPVSVATAQIGPNVPAPLIEEPPPPPPAPNDFDEGGISTVQKVLIFGSAALVLAAIAFVIVRDARRAAPVDEHKRERRSDSAQGAGGSAKAARERERQQRAKRSKAKAARQQRKRNRPH
ncbi:MAG TPA: hypothetical protein VNA28_09670 [Solirubrobacteraceae bacterium]|nr:hypothetical protein [Solirubrobacteraceae bacterium]